MAKSSKERRPRSRRSTGGLEGDVALIVMGDRAAARRGSRAAYDQSAQEAARLTAAAIRPRATAEDCRVAAQANRIAARSARDAGVEEAAVGHERIALDHERAAARRSQEATPSDREFADAVRRTARQIGDAGRGSRDEVFVCEIWPRLREDDARFRAMTEREFKRALLRAHEGDFLRLTRANFAPGHERRRVHASEVESRAGNFHFVLEGPRAAI